VKRPYPCFVCNKTETSIAHSQDPWCGDDCHKKLARLVGMQQWDLKVIEFDTAMRRLAKLNKNKKFEEPIPYTEIGKEIRRGRNGVEVYGSEDLLRKAEEPGHWRDAGLWFYSEEWDLPQVQ
jgi:hypothetical protein